MVDKTPDVSRGKSRETVVTLKGDPDGETVQHLQKSLSALAGVLETDYHLLTKKLIVEYDPNELTHFAIVQEIGRALKERQNQKRSDL